MFFMDFRNEVSNIDNLLANEDVTLTEILDESDIIQECKTQNKALIDFLVKPDNLTELINYIVTTPAEDVEENVQYKYPHVAYEVLSCDVCEIVDPIVQDEVLLNRLWSFVEQEPPLNPLLASFFGKVLTVIFGQRSQDVFEYLKNHNAVDTLLRHIETSAIMQLFLKIASIIETRENRQMISEWLTKERFIEKLVEGLHPSQSPEKHYNIAQLLCELVQLSRSTSQACLDNDPLILCLERQETISLLLDNMFSDGSNVESSLVEGISVLLSLVEPRKAAQFDGPDDSLTPPAAERIAQGVNTVLKALEPRLKDFNRVLLDPPKMNTMHTTAGSLEPPLGKVRLHIAWLIKAAVVTDTSFIISEIIQLSSLNVLLDLFFKYEWNNFLHTHIVHCLSAVVMSEPHPENDNPMLRHLIADCNLITRVLDAWEETSTRRKGYMGHLTNLFNELVSCKDSGASSEIFNTLFADLPENEQERWSQTVAGSLDSLNKTNTAPMQPINDSKLHSSSDDDEEEYRPESSIHLTLSLHQEFANYQMHQMTDEFVESFGYNEEDLQNNDTDDNPFDEVGNVDFNINAKEETLQSVSRLLKTNIQDIQNNQSNAAIFEAVCNQKIHQCNDAGSDDEEMWEEKELSYSSADGSKQSKPGSDGEGDDSAFKNNSDSYRDSHGSSDSSSSEDDQEQSKNTKDNDVDMKDNNELSPPLIGNSRTPMNTPTSSTSSNLETNGPSNRLEINKDHFVEGKDLDWNEPFDTDSVAAMDILDSAAVGWGDSSANAVKADDVPSFANFADMAHFSSSSMENNMFQTNPFDSEEKEKTDKSTLLEDVKMSEECPTESQTDASDNQCVPQSIPLSTTTTTTTQSIENNREDRERSSSVELAGSETTMPLVVTSKVMGGFVVIDTTVTTSSSTQSVAVSTTNLKSSHMSYEVKPNYPTNDLKQTSLSEVNTEDSTAIKENGITDSHLSHPLESTDDDVTTAR